MGVSVLFRFYLEMGVSVLSRDGCLGSSLRFFREMGVSVLSRDGCLGSFFRFFPGSSVLPKARKVGEQTCVV